MINYVSLIISILVIIIIIIIMVYAIIYINNINNHQRLKYSITYYMEDNKNATDV